MPKAHRPKAGSRMFWPRTRAKRAYARLRKQSIKALNVKDAKPIGFAGYKRGMTHVLVTDNRAKSLTKGTTLNFAVTVIECPPVKVASIKLYKYDSYGLHTASEIFSTKDKELKRKLSLPKKSNSDSKIKEAESKLDEYQELRVMVHTQPSITGISKKKPDVFELSLGGKSVKEKFAWAKENLGKEISIESIFSPGEQIDVHAVTKGKGFQGPVKRFGVTLRNHKSEKTIRGPANLGAWTPTHVGFEVAHAGQMGYHQRTDYNKLILKISNKPEEINPNGGFVRSGIVKGTYILLKGSVPGPANRLIIFTKALRGDKLVSKEAPAIEYVSISSKQRK